MIKIVIYFYSLILISPIYAANAEVSATCESLIYSEKISQFSFINNDQLNKIASALVSLELSVTDLDSDLTEPNPILKRIKLDKFARDFKEYLNIAGKLGLEIFYKELQLQREANFKNSENNKTKKLENAKNEKSIKTYLKTAVPWKKKIVIEDLDDSLVASLSPDSKTIVTAGKKDPKLWDIDTGAKLITFSGHTRAILSVEFSADGKYLLTASKDKTARLWDIATGMELKKFSGHTKSVNSARFSPDGKSIVTVSNDNTAIIWDVESGKPLKNFNGHTSRISSGQFSLDGKSVITTSDDESAKLWGSNFIDFRWHSEAYPKSAEFSSDGKFILITYIDQLAVLWKVDEPKVIRKFESIDIGFNSSKLSSDGKSIIFTDGLDVRIFWDFNEDLIVQSFNASIVILRYAEFSRDEKLILTILASGRTVIWERTIDSIN